MKPTKEILDQIAQEYKGTTGGPEGETIIVDASADKKDGFVTVWSNKADATKIIERCRDSIISIRKDSNGVLLKIERCAFRGPVCAFRKCKPKKVR